MVFEMADQNIPDNSASNGLDMHVESNEREEFCEEDLVTLDHQLDSLHAALDHMESWSDALHEKVADFLKTTREQNRLTQLNKSSCPPPNDVQESSKHQGPDG